MLIDSHCKICGTNAHLDQHHVIPRGMGGSKDPAVNDESNLMTLCRKCHRNLHDGIWEVARLPKGIRVLDKKSGEQVMRRLHSSVMNAPSLFHLLNLAESSLSTLHGALPYLTDDQLVEAFDLAHSFGKRSWGLEAAILYEAQKRSIYGERTLEAIAQRFQIGIRQAQKYALMWRVFFAQDGEEENVNIDAIILDEPSWYLVATTETKEPEKWLAYAQDRKMEDARYSVVAFRRDIQLARLTHAVEDAREERGLSTELPALEKWACPWIKLMCVRSGKPVPFRDCGACEFEKEDFCETKPNYGEV